MSVRSYGSQLVTLIRRPPAHNLALSCLLVVLTLSLVYFNIFIPDIFNFSGFSIFFVLQFLASAFRTKSRSAIITLRFQALMTYWVLVFSLFCSSPELP